MCEAREQLSACPIQISTSTALSILPVPSADPWMSYSGIPHEANRHQSDLPRATESRLQIPPATIPAIANTQSAFAAEIDNALSVKYFKVFMGAIG